MELRYASRRRLDLLVLLALVLWHSGIACFVHLVWSGLIFSGWLLVHEEALMVDWRIHDMTHRQQIFLNFLAV